MGDQVASFYPAIAPPVPIELTLMPPHPCPYLPDRQATLRAIFTNRLEPDIYQRFMDASFRRSGLVVYQPVCQGCRACQSLRVPVKTFHLNKSQRRCLRRNTDLVVTTSPASASDEKFELYKRYQAGWHKMDVPDSRSTFEHFLYYSPVETVEFCYRDGKGQLLAVGICDVCHTSLSSVYFYFDPAYSERSLGTYGALREIDFAAESGISHYYLGYRVEGCRKMEYKACFRPCEILHADGCWRAIND